MAMMIDLISCSMRDFNDGWHSGWLSLLRSESRGKDEFRTLYLRSRWFFQYAIRNTHGVVRRGDHDYSTAYYFDRPIGQFSELGLPWPMVDMAMAGESSWGDFVR